MLIFALFVVTAIYLRGDGCASAADAACVDRHCRCCDRAPAGAEALVQYPDRTATRIIRALIAYDIVSAAVCIR